MSQKQDLEHLLERLVASTRSPRGRFSAASSWVLLERRLHAGRRRLWWTRVAAVAAVVLVCLAGGWCVYESLRPVAMQTVSTLAETRTVTLPDHTEVTLNRYSSLVYPSRFKDGQRRVSLQGGAYFEVAKDKERPFVVQTDAVDVQVLGTHFDVEAYDADNEVRTTLLEGSVAVSLKPVGERLVLKLNERAIYNKVEGTLHKETVVVAGNSPDWSRGMLRFSQEPLEEIVRRLANTYHADIRIADAELAAYRLTAAFHLTEPLEQVLQLLQTAGGFGCRKEGTQYVLYRNKTELYQ